MRSRKTMMVAAALAATLTLATAACSKNATANTPTAASEGVSLFGTDGVMDNSFGDDLKVPGLLNGMSGTAAIDPLSPAFVSRLKAIDPSLDDFNYAGQAYDAVVITALAAQTARSVNGKTMASYMNGVTTSGTECDDVVSCLTDIAKGKNIAYHGIAVTNGFTDVGEPSTASYGTLHFGTDNHIDDRKTEYVNAGDPGSASTQKSPAPAPITYYGGPALKLGLLLPKTGALGAQGKPIIAGAELAVKDINAGGGVLGKPIVTEFKDDATDDKVAMAGARKLIADGVSAIVGPSFSQAAADVVPLVVAAGIIEITPSATSADLSTVDDHTLFFRTAPSDILQAQAVADVILRSGAQRVFIVARSDSYGTGLEHDVAQALKDDGIESGNLATAEYSVDPSVNDASTFTQIAGTIKTFDADAVLMIGYDEIAGVIKAMAAAHLTFKAS
jgi:ABC-type branched-subunit amino acid transport system substrate-binding protein